MESTARAATGADRFRRLNQPEMVLVQAEAGKPKAISSRGRWRQVIEIDEIWRVEEGWWRRLPIRRTYFRVHLEADVDVTVFQDLVEATWWIQKY